MNIKFLQLLPRRGKLTEALFEVGDKDIKIGVTDIFLATCKTFESDWTVESFLRKFGELVIKKMVAENNLSDYIFESRNFTKANGQGLNLKEVKEGLEGDIVKAEEKRSSIGFK